MHVSMSRRLTAVWILALHAYIDYMLQDALGVHTYVHIPSLDEDSDLSGSFLGCLHVPSRNSLVVGLTTWSNSVRV